MNYETVPRDLKTCRLFIFDICACSKIFFIVISQLMLPWQRFKVRGVKNNIFKQKLAIFTPEMKSASIN